MAEKLRDKPELRDDLCAKRKEPEGMGCFCLSGEYSTEYNIISSNKHIKARFRMR
jgi:hypothetical protein